MASSKSPSDKYAFLLSGTINARFEKDLKLVFDTLTDYYGFPQDHIWISCGSSLNTPSDFPNAHIKVITSAADLDSEIASFCTAASAAPSGTDKNTGVIYITGEAVNGTGEYKITNTGLVVGPDYLAVGNFDQTDLMMCEYIEVLQNSYSQDMVDNFTGMPQDACVIYSNPNDDEGHTNPAGSYFTNSWVDALRLIPLPAGTGHANYFADMLGTAPENTDLLVSMYESFLYAGESLTLGGHSLPVYEVVNNNKPYFLGEPEFLIQDGDNSTVGWWESPDIYLTHPTIPGKTDDLYMPDDPLNLAGPWNNTINVIFRNTGTHPLRKYSVGIQVFRQPLGSSSPTAKFEGMDTGTVLKPVSLISYNNFNKSYQQLVTWPTPFYSGIIHECVRAKAQLPVTPVDFTWNVLANLNETQRNLDPSSDPPVKAGKDSKGDIFRGRIKHEYSVKNHFNETHQFIIMTIPEFQKSLRKADITWQIKGSGDNWMKLRFENIEPGFKGVSFILKGGEIATFRMEYGFKKGEKVKEVRLPFEILIDRKEGVSSRTPLAKGIGGKFSAIAGLSIILKNDHSGLFCKVTDPKGKPARRIPINIETSDKITGGAFVTDNNGELILEDVNPGFYLLKVESCSGNSLTRLVELKNGKTTKLNLKIN